MGKEAAKSSFKLFILKERIPVVAGRRGGGEDGCSGPTGGIMLSRGCTSLATSPGKNLFNGDWVPYSPKVDD